MRWPGVAVPPHNRRMHKGFPEMLSYILRKPSEYCSHTFVHLNHEAHFRAAQAAVYEHMVKSNCIYDRAPAKIFEKTCFWFGATSYTTLLGDFETRLVKNRHPAWWCHLIQGERQAYVPQHQRVWFHVSAGTHACAGSTLTATGALNMCLYMGCWCFFNTAC